MPVNLVQISIKSRNISEVEAGPASALGKRETDLECQVLRRLLTTPTQWCECQLTYSAWLKPDRRLPAQNKSQMGKIRKSHELLARHACYGARLMTRLFSATIMI